MKEENEGYTHAEKITLFIRDVLQNAEKKNFELDAVAVSSGPGSYTGLRIGMSVAKGLCYGLEIPLIAIPTLLSLSASIRNSQFAIRNSILCPMLDARRMEVYCALYDEQLNELEKVSAKVIDESSFSEWLKENKIYFFGDGAAKCKPLLSKNNNAIFIDHIFPSASFMMLLSEQKFQREEFEDVALFEPFYLKEFMAKK